MKGAIVITAVIVAVALGACRMERRHEPMKLGAEKAPATATQQIAQ